MELGEFLVEGWKLLIKTGITFGWFYFAYRFFNVLEWTYKKWINRSFSTIQVIDCGDNKVVDRVLPDREKIDDYFRDINKKDMVI